MNFSKTFKNKNNFIVIFSDLFRLVFSIILLKKITYFVLKCNRSTTNILSDVPNASTHY